MPLIRLLFIAFLAVVAMAAVPVLVKSTTANEVTIGIARLLIAIGAFFPMFILDRRARNALTAKDWLLLLLIGLAFGGHWITYFISIKQATPAIAAMALSTYGIQYLVLARIFTGERFAPLEWLAVLLCFLGCIAAAPALRLDNTVTQGIAVGILSGFLYAVLPLLHQRCRHISTNVRTWGQFFFAFLVFVPLLPQVNWQLSVDDFWMLAVLGVLCTVVGHGLWVKSSTELPTLYTGMMYYLYVPLVLFSSWLFLDEPLTLAKLVGAAMILSASIGITLYRYRRLGV